MLFPAALWANTYLGQAFSVWDSRPATTYNVQWNFDIQQQLPGDLLIDVAYTDNRGIKLTQSRAFDALPPSYLNLGTGLQTLVSNPFLDLVSTGPLSAATV